LARIHLASIGTKELVHTRLADIGQEFEFEFKQFQTVDDLSEIPDYSSVMLSIFCASGIENAKDISGHVQGIRQLAFDTFIVVLVDKRISADNVSFIKKSGANLILTESSLFDSSKIEYICSQIIRGSLVPVKASDFIANTEIDFTIKVIMPLNEKILSAATKGSNLSANKLKKFEEAKELYIGRDDLPKFMEYTDRYMDKSNHGIQARCRIQYLNLCKAHADLVFLLIDQSQTTSFDQGRELLENAQKLGQELLVNLAMASEPSTIINNSTFGDSGSTERSTAITALAGLIAVQLGDIQESEVLQAGLLCDLGLVNTSPAVLKKVRAQGFSSLDEAEFSDYKTHPMKSIDLCLNHKLPLSEKTKKIISCTHEKTNGKGFPQGLLGDKIPKESQLIQFSQLVDERSMIKFGEERKTVKMIKKEIFQEELAKGECFSLDLLKRISELSTN
jgi:response regulator RpfG family c-di-GMP phosphodiesterase